MPVKPHALTSHILRGGLGGVSLKVRVLIALVVGGICTTVQWTPAVQRLDYFALDAAMQRVRSVGPKPAAEDIVIVGIDEATDRSIVEPFAMWHQHVGRALEMISAGRPALIAVDIVMPERSYDAIRPGMDEALARGIVAAKAAGPIVVAVALGSNGKLRRIEPFIALAIGPDAMALGYSHRDLDGVSRRVELYANALGSDLPGFAESIALATGVMPEAGLIDFACGGMFQYVPLAEVLKWSAVEDAALARTAFAGKIVILGSVLPDIDRVRQPLSLAGWESENRYAPGVILHAQSVRALRSGCVIREIGFWGRAFVPLIGAAVALSPGVWSTSASAVVATLGLLVVSFGLYIAGWFLPPTAAISAALLAASSRSAAEAAAQRRVRRMLEKRFSGYVSPDLLRAILAAEVDVDSPQRVANLAFLFADIRGFTTRSEQQPASEIVDLLNRYYSAVVPVIHAHGGTVDNFRGDGVMAFFGAPGKLNDAARSAGLAAIDILEKLKLLNVVLAAEGREPIAIGIGLAVGTAVVGNIGAADRYDYTAIGDAVNVAARLQSQCKPLNMQVIGTAEIARSVGTDLALRLLGDVELSGHTPVKAYGLPLDSSSEHSDALLPNMPATNA